ncbi:TonB-dependent receptor [Zhongshania marina]|uniref:TonB-dependent receptor n=1 Tax=Zhongshania marina TaxID=2304603 RepID=A0ABX9W667_9GAMM|nr:TonB-dependent receptor [Zhongshania marina]
MNIGTIKFFVGVAISCWLTMSGAYAEKASNRLIEEVVVTAQKRSENLQEVPISISAYSGDKLEALNIDGPDELVRITPGLQYDSVVGYALVFIRGVGTEVFLPSFENSVATYTDDVYMPFTSGLSQDFGKIERVEVLKGPQGTLFGRNATGGAIRIITAKPSDELVVDASAEIGNFDKRKYKLYVAGPIVDRLQASLSLVQTESESFYKRPSNSASLYPYPDDESKGYQLKVNWDISDSMNATITAQKTEEDGLGSSIFVSQNVKTLFQATVPSYEEAYVSDPDTPSYFGAESEMVYGELSWESPYFFDIKLLASDLDVNTNLYIDFEGSSSPLVGFNPKNQGGEFTSAELQILSNDNGWHSDRWNWILGYYYYRARDMGFRHLTLDVAQTLTNPLSGVLELADNLLGVLGAGAPNGVSVHLSGLIDSDSDAIFTQSNINLTDSISLTLGVRYQTETRTLAESTLGLEYFNDEFSPPILDYPKQTLDAKDISPKVVLDYKFADDSMFYLSWQEAFKSGGFNVVNITQPPTAVEPEKISAYELGLKGSLRSGSFQYSSAIFQYFIEDQQALYVSLQSSGAITIENAGETEITGLDVEFTWQPLPVSLPNLVLIGAGVYLDGEYVSFEDATGFDQNTGLLRTDLDYSGKTTTRTPKYSYNVGVNYRWDFTDSVIEAGASMYYNDGYFFNPGNTIEQESYELISAQISYLYEPAGLRISAFGQNLTESVYYLNRFETDFNVVGTYAPPRSYGLKLSYQL